MEQPTASYLYKYAPVRECLLAQDFRSASFRMVGFGHSSWKPTVLQILVYGSCNWVSVFEADAKDKARAALADKDGVCRRGRARERGGG